MIFEKVKSAQGWSIHFCCQSHKNSSCFCNWINLDYSRWSRRMVQDDTYRAKCSVILSDFLQNKPHINMVTVKQLKKLISLCVLPTSAPTWSVRVRPGGASWDLWGKTPHLIHSCTSLGNEDLLLDLQAERDISTSPQQWTEGWQPPGSVLHFSAPSKSCPWRSRHLLTITAMVSWGHWCQKTHHTPVCLNVTFSPADDVIHVGWNSCPQAVIPGVTWLWQNVHLFPLLALIKPPKFAATEQVGFAIVGPNEGSFHPVHRLPVSSRHAPVREGSRVPRHSHSVFEDPVARLLTEGGTCDYFFKLHLRDRATIFKVNRSCALI